MMALGAVGVISVLGNALPRPLSDLIRLCLKGNFSAALPAHLRLLEITRLIFAEGNPAGVKAALKQLSICDDTVRLPLVKASSQLNEQIAVQLKQFQ
ncbi:4-hydroxy-tetrahydrodipicolinate synthase [compost metagenome]